MSRFSEKGYWVKENAPIYLTADMDKTARWFEETLGWHSTIVERDADGAGRYGVVFDMLPEVERTHLAPFTGLHLFSGQPDSRLISFMQVNDIEAMYQYITAKGWEDITHVKAQPWGGKTCTLTTIDGYRISLFD